MGEHNNGVQDVRQLSLTQCTYASEYGGFDATGLCSRIGFLPLEKESCLCFWWSRRVEAIKLYGTYVRILSCTFMLLECFLLSFFVKNRNICFLTSSQADRSRFESRDRLHRIRRTQKHTYTELSSADAHPGRHCCAHPSSKWVSCISTGTPQTGGLKILLILSKLCFWNHLSLVFHSNFGCAFIGAFAPWRAISTSCPVSSFFIGSSFFFRNQKTKEQWNQNWSFESIRSSLRNMHFRLTS